MTYSRGTTIPPRGMLDILRRGNLGALVLPLALLIAGGIARARLTRKTVPYSWHGVALSHPAGWAVAEQSTDPEAGESVVLVDLLGPGRIKPRITLRIAPMPVEAPAPDQAADSTKDPVPTDEATPTKDQAKDQAPDANAAPATATGDAPVPTKDPTKDQVKDQAKDPADAEPAPAPAVAAAAPPANRLPLYYALSEQSVPIGTFTATRVDSAFAFTPKAVPGRKGDIPVVMRAIDLVVLRGTSALSIQLAAPIEDFEAQRPTLETIVESLRIDPASAPAEPPPPAEPTVAAAPGPGAVTVIGEIVDADSRVAIPGAIVLFLAPGTSVSDVTDDNLTKIAYTTAMADSTGHFAGNRPLGRPAHYGVMVVADGYRWIGTDDGVDVAPDAPERLDLGTIPLRRR